MNLKQLIKKIANYCTTIINQVNLKTHNVKFKTNIKMNGIIYVVGKGSISLGNDVKINSSLKSNPIGGANKTILRTIGSGEISIGDHTGISNSTIVSAKRVTIGENVLIGGSCCIYDTDFHSLEYIDRIEKDDKNILKEEIVIENGAFIGAHTIILKGTKIGEKSVIGAGSVVSKNIPPNEVWGGNPIKFIKKI